MTRTLTNPRVLAALTAALILAVAAALAAASYARNRGDAGADQRPSAATVQGPTPAQPDPPQIQQLSRDRMEVERPLIDAADAPPNPTPPRTPKAPNAPQPDPPELDSAPANCVSRWCDPRRFAGTVVSFDGRKLTLRTDSGGTYTARVDARTNVACPPQTAIDKGRIFNPARPSPPRIGPDGPSTPPRLRLRDRYTCPATEISAGRQVVGAALGCDRSGHLRWIGVALAERRAESASRRWGVAAGSSSARASERSRYDREALRRDLAAIHEAGITGVLGEVRGQRERLLARAGVADLEGRRPVPYRGSFRTGSSTKTFVATVILQLVGEGRMSLDDSVEKWLPGVVAGNGNDGRRISVRQLLQHTSGLRDYLRELPQTAEDFQHNRFRNYQPEELVELALRQRPSFAPGTSWEYSNTNYVLAGMIIERVTGRTWDREVRDRILRPLGLQHTFSPGDSPYIPRPRATAYHQFAPGGAPVDVTTRNESWGDAAGNMITTTGDLTRFWRALARGELLRPAQLAAMQETVPAEGFPVEGAHYGLGLIWLPLSCGGGYWTHGGDTLGYSTRGGVTPDGRRSIAISLSSRIADVRPSQLADQAVDHALCTVR